MHESPADPQRLWQADHAYYCSESNYFAGGTQQHFESWADFIDDEGEADMDLNLIFRWDWLLPRDAEGDRAEKSDDVIPWAGDENYRDCLLQLFYMGQRKGLYRCVEVDVSRADEPAVRAWLQPRFEYLMALWEPFTLTAG